MAESIILVGDTTKKVHTNSYTVGANTVEDEVVVFGPYPYPTYTALIQAASIAVAGDHLITLNSAAGTKTRIHLIRLRWSGPGTAAVVRAFPILRTTTTNPTGGKAITIAAHDTVDTVGATARSIPAVKGTESTVIKVAELNVTQALSATATNPHEVWEWRQAPNGKPITLPSGVTNGLAVKNSTALAAGTVSIEIEFTETAF